MRCEKCKRYRKTIRELQETIEIMSDPKLMKRFNKKSDSSKNISLETMKEHLSSKK